MRHTLESTRRLVLPEVTFGGQILVFTIENLVKVCKNCYNELQDPPKIKIKQWLPSKYVWERVHVDFLGPMDGNYYFVLIDADSKRPEVFKMTDIKDGNHN
jgi:hypothetical protein